MYSGMCAGSQACDQCVNDCVMVSKCVLHAFIATTSHTTSHLGLTKMSIFYRHHCHIDGLVQERRKSSASAMELRLSCTDPSICNMLKDFFIVFWLKCHWSSFLGFELELVIIGLGNGLVLNVWQSITWTSDDPVHWCIYAWLGAVSVIWRCCLMSIVISISIMEIRWYYDCLISTIWFPIMVRWHIYIDSASR